MLKKIIINALIILFLVTLIFTNYIKIIDEDMIPESVNFNTHHISSFPGEIIAEKMGYVSPSKV